MSIAVEEGRLPHLGRNAEQECERLYGRHAQDVRRYARMVLRNGSDADDVVQQTFLKALRALRAGVRPERPRQWLIAIAHNECRMHFRRASRRPLEVELERAAEAVEVEEGSTSVEAVREALAQLAPNQRTALVLRELEGRTYEEIAETLELSGSAVETLLFRARRALREQLEATESCDDAQALLAADDLDELSRGRLRAHTRTCRACATLERRRRGRIAAARRTLAGLLPFPSWLPTLFEGGAAGGAKAVAVVAAAAVATTGAVEASMPARHHERPSTTRLALPRAVPAAAVPSVRGAAPLATSRVRAAPTLPARPQRRTPVAPSAAPTAPAAQAPAVTSPAPDPVVPAAAVTVPAVSAPAAPTAQPHRHVHRPTAANGGLPSEQHPGVQRPTVLPSLPDPTAVVPTLPEPTATPPPATVTVTVPQAPVSLPAPPPVTVPVPTLTKP